MDRFAVQLLGLLPLPRTLDKLNANAIAALLFLGLTSFIGPWQSLAGAQVTSQACGPVWGTHHWGPFDYRRTSPRGKAEVESAHFTPVVESLARGRTSATPGPDLNYTLRTFPNHHRALVAASRLATRDGKDQPVGMEWPIECYFERAIRFAPDDTVVRGLYAKWLGERKRSNEGEMQLEAGLKHAGDNPLTVYNIGLVYFELGNFAAARQQAVSARELGWPGTDLIEKLKAAGKWDSPGTAPAPADASASGVASTLPSAPGSSASAP